MLAGTVKRSRRPLKSSAIRFQHLLPSRPARARRTRRFPGENYFDETLGVRSAGAAAGGSTHLVKGLVFGVMAGSQVQAGQSHRGPRWHPIHAVVPPEDFAIYQNGAYHTDRLTLPVYKRG